MAGHLEIESVEELKDVEREVRKHFEKGLIGIDMRTWTELGKEHKFNSYDKVFFTEKEIPEGIVCGNRALIEVHYDTQLNKISQIYLVA